MSSTVPTGLLDADELDRTASMAIRQLPGGNPGATDKFSSVVHGRGACQGHLVGKSSIRRGHRYGSVCRRNRGATQSHGLSGWHLSGVKR